LPDKEKENTPAYPITFFTVFIPFFSGYFSINVATKSTVKAEYFINIPLPAPCGRKKKYQNGIQFKSSGKHKNGKDPLP